MAEYALKIGDTSTYDDGDILCAFTDRHIQATHMQHLTHKRLAAKDGHGLIPPDSLIQARLERVSQFRFERLDKRTIQRIVIATEQAVKLSHTPNADGEYIDVPEFVARRLKAGTRPMFGRPGREVWYGGNTDYSQAAVDDVWHHIETHTEHRKANYDLFPAGTRDLIDHFFVVTDSFDDATANELVAPLLNDKGEMVKKRKHQVKWGELPGISAKTRDDIRDKSRSVDGRRKGSFRRADIVVAKSLTAVID